tara:strand:+ start:14808 stop:15050 length:243 start_codon:yes stop_codon:yes gene_type:complete
MKIIVNTKVIEKAISYNGDSYMVWEYTNDNKNKEIAIMDPTGYDVSLMTEVIEDGDVETEVHILSPDPEEYINQKFMTFK